MALLTNVSLDSPAGRRHEARLIRVHQNGGGLEDEIAEYQRTLTEAGALGA